MERNETFLSQFELASRSLIANKFHYAARNGADTASQVLAEVEWKSRVALMTCNDDVGRLLALHHLLEVLHTHRPAALQHAQLVLDREHLPAAERARLKAERSELYRRAWMSQQLPTDKQKLLLRQLGCSRRPESRQQASDWIGVLLSTRRSDSE